MGSSEQTYFVIPLSVQEEGQDYIVGNKDVGDFYQFPKEGVAVIGFLQQGASVDEAKRRCAEQFPDPVDVDDFISVLLEIGFISPVEQQHEHLKRLADGSPERRLKFSLSRKMAGLFVSLPALCAYVAVVACAAFFLYQRPQLGINVDAFYLKQHLTITLVALLVLHGMTTALHELGHMIAAASRGVESYLGMGHRLWNIVAEADISGIFSLPKQQRYFPLFAGILVDIFSISVIVIVIHYLAIGNTLPLAVQILQALILQILITISWQFNVFLRTDIYYAFCNYSGYPDLDSDARIYISSKIHSLSFGMLGKPAGTAKFHSKPILRAFVVIWLLGRVASLAFLFGIIIPTLTRYAEDAYRSLAGIGAAKYDKWDIGIFVLVSTAVIGAGMYVWLSNKIKLSWEKRNVSRP